MPCFPYEDIKSWFQRSKTFSCSSATSADIQKLEKSIDTEIPNALKSLLLETNGTLWYMEKQAMTTKRIGVIVMKLEGILLINTFIYAYNIIHVSS